MVRFIDLWFPTQKDQEPSKATHYNAGVEYWYNDIQSPLKDIIRNMNIW
ncbi:MAG: hypothetical protein U5N26_02960 [Candidatus Marinimicrobia bacterium]|nr:hypothetical protein [Candidatus Neomarinimicrobiota bacterium]